MIYVLLLLFSFLKNNIYSSLQLLRYGVFHPFDLSVSVYCSDFVPVETETDNSFDTRTDILNAQ